MSTFRVEVVPVRLDPHPNADSLSLVKVRGYTVVVKTDDWQDGQLAAYIPPDSVVDTTRPQFAFLADHPRVTVRRFRGVYSQGLLVPAPAGSAVGDDVAEALSVTHYEPPLPAQTGGEAEPGPAGYRPVYDVENYHRYPDLVLPGEEVVVTEKIHGANGRFCYADGRFWCGSRTEWKRESEGNVWWRALHAAKILRAFLVSMPHLTAYGEVYGSVQSLKYGHDKGAVSLRLFDFWDHFDARFLAVDELRGYWGVNDLDFAPVLYRGPFDAERVVGLAEGESVIPGANHLREGVVVRPVVERFDPTVGRVQLKVVSNRFLEKGR